MMVHCVLSIAGRPACLAQVILATRTSETLQQPGPQVSLPLPPPSIHSSLLHCILPAAIAPSMSPPVSRLQVQGRNVQTHLVPTVSTVAWRRLVHARVACMRQLLSADRQTVSTALHGWHGLLTDTVTRSLYDWTIAVMGHCVGSGRLSVATGGSFVSQLVY